MVRCRQFTAAVVGIVGATVMLFGVGCSDRDAERPECDREQAQACQCEDGTTGSRVCQPDRTWGRCRCSSPDTGSVADAGVEEDTADGRAEDGGRADTSETSGSSDADAGGDQQPYGGMPHAIPGGIEAEDFDRGGEGVAYHDRSPGNLGDSSYRPEAAVDLTRVDGGGHNLGYVEEGEWLEYTVEVAEAGTYELGFRVGTPRSDAEFRVSFGAPSGVSKKVDVPTTGGWDKWEGFKVRPVTLERGRQVLRIEMGRVEFDLDRMWLTEAGR